MSREKSFSLREQALQIFQAHGGILTTGEARSEGIHPRILYELRDDELIEQLGWGLYGLPGLPGVSNPDFATVTKKVPTGVICLVSALYIHELTTQIPRWIDVAVRMDYRPPTIHHPPVHFHWFTERVFREGIERLDLGRISVNIYSKEKSIVDCFRLRRKVGIDVAIEALKNYWIQGAVDLDAISQLAKESRVYRLMKPYIETVIYD